ncbi:MAG: Peptidase, partial [Conexibacter sp.]|nr:Peptidase [Conexibacter sp.]
AYSVKSALLPPGPTSKGGLIKLTNEHPEWTPGEVAARAINGGGDPQYAAKCNSWAAEAAKTIKTFGGGDVPYATATAGKAATTRNESLLRTPQLVRGTQQDRNEDSWTAMRRIAADYGYRCFAIGNDVYYISDEALMRSRPHVTISEASAGVDTIDWEWTPRKAVNTTTVFCRAESWQTPAGAVVLVEDTHLANGRWLVSTYRQSRFEPNATVELIRGTSLLKPRVTLEHYTRKVTLAAIPGTVGGAKGKVVIDPNANLPGRPMQKSILAYVAAMAGIYGKPIVITTGTNHNQFVEGTTRVSDHPAGNAADLGMVANGGSDDSPVGDRLATAALMLAGVSNEQATQMAGRELVFTKVHNGLHINILWRTYTGGNHHNHVHVGVRPA